MMAFMFFVLGFAFQQWSGWCALKGIKCESDPKDFVTTSAIMFTVSGVILFMAIIANSKNNK